MHFGISPTKGSRGQFLNSDKNASFSFAKKKKIEGFFIHLHKKIVVRDIFALLLFSTPVLQGYHSIRKAWGRIIRQMLKSAQIPRPVSSRGPCRPGPHGGPLRSHTRAPVRDFVPSGENIEQRSRGCPRGFPLTSAWPPAE